MQPIKTRSTKERMIRNSLLALMLIGYAGWSFYDGYRGYPQDNLEHAKKKLPASAQPNAKISPLVTRDILPEIQVGERISDLEEKLGPAATKGRTDAGVSEAIWFGPAVILTVAYDSMGYVRPYFESPEGLVPYKIEDGKHTATDLLVQKGMGTVIGILGLVALLRVFGMLVTSVTLSDDGLKPGGKPLITYDAMTGWDTSQYKERGRIHLVYNLDGQERTFTLDDYRHAAFRPIVEEICTRKGFESPFRESTEHPSNAQTDGTESSDRA